MTQEQAFLAAIRRRPGSRTERLVYADWLTDRGDPRGEFIHLQCQASRLSRHSARRLDTEARIHELLFRHEAEWLGPMLGVIGNWEWRNGMLCSVTVVADIFLANADRWLPALPLLGVHLRKARPHIAELARCKGLRHLTGLFLGDNEMKDADLSKLLKSPYLKRIRSLFLQSNSISDKGAKALAKSANLPRLRELCLGHNALGDEGVAALARSPHLNRLRSLILSLTFMDETGLRALLNSPLFPRLRILGLGTNRLPPGMLAELARSPNFAGVRCLSFAMNQQNDADVAALAGSPHAAGLRHLALEAFETLGNPALVALAASPHLGQLRTLNLGCGVWDRTGARALGRSRSLTSLRGLQMCQSNERARGIPKAMFGGPLARRLTNLNLEVSRVGTAGLKALASHSRPLRLRCLEMPLSRDMGGPWETLLGKGLLVHLTDLTLTDPPRGALRAMLAPDRLPELRDLDLRGLPSYDEFQELLASPLFRRLHAFRMTLAYKKEGKQGGEVIRRLTAAWHNPALRRLGLTWSLSADHVRQLAAAAPPPALTELELGSFHMGKEGAAALAGWPGLNQLRHLELWNSSSQALPGLEALAKSPHVGPLLRVDLRNAHLPRETIPVIRRRFGLRFAVGGRMEPRVISLGGWGKILGDGED